MAVVVKARIAVDFDAPNIVAKAALYEFVADNAFDAVGTSNHQIRSAVVIDAFDMIAGIKHPPILPENPTLPQVAPASKPLQKC